MDYPEIEKLQNRVGKFKVSGAVYKQETIKRIFASMHFVPYEVKYIGASDVWCITGYSDCFDIVNEGESIPRYELLCSSRMLKGVETISVEANRD